jgi:hypothetical protein
MDLPTAEKIVFSFNEILENRALPAATQVADVNELPYPKDRIREAFQCMFLNVSNDEHRKLLLASYIYLARYQIGVGPRRIGPGANDLPSNARQLAPAEINQASAKFSAQYDQYARWLPLVKADQTFLLAEMERLWGEVKAK